MSIQNITAPQLEQWLQDNPTLKVLDVRTPEEYLQLGHIPGSTLLPLHELPMHWRQLDPQAQTVIVCQHGVRSLDASFYLQQAGFQEIYNLVDGMAAWSGPMEYGPPQSLPAGSP